MCLYEVYMLHLTNEVITTLQIIKTLLAKYHFILQKFARKHSISHIVNQMFSIILNNWWVNNWLLNNDFYNYFNSEDFEYTPTWYRM